MMNKQTTLVAVILVTSLFEAIEPARLEAATGDTADDERGFLKSMIDKIWGFPSTPTEDILTTQSSSPPLFEERTDDDDSYPLDASAWSQMFSDDSHNTNEDDQLSGETEFTIQEMLEITAQPVQTGA